MPFFKSVGHIPDDFTPEEVQKEYRRRYSLAAYHTRRAQLVADLGGVCAKCRSPNELCFARTAKAPPALVPKKLVQMNAKARKRLLKFVVLLCEVCAAELVYNKGRVTHGGYFSAYVKKCRCEICAEYKVNYNIMRREDRRDRKLRGAA